jgi:hypothetical protein
MTSKIFIHARGTTNFVFINKYGLQGSFQLWQQPDESSMLHLFYGSNALNISSPAYDLNLWGNKIPAVPSPATMKSQLVPNDAIGLGDQLVTYSDLIKGVVLPYTKLAGAKLGTYQAAGNMLQGDTDFNEGVWKPVKDCLENPSTNPPEYLPNQPGHGGVAQLSSPTTGRTCLGQVSHLQLKPDHYYRLAFEYRAIKGSNINFYYNVGHTDGSNFKGYQKYVTDYVASQGKWETYEYTFKPKLPDANEFDLFFYEDPASEATNIMQYDNVSLEEYSERAGSTIVPTNLLAANVLNQAVKMGKGSTKITFSDKPNLLDGNTNFEGGLWKAVKDCVGKDSKVRMLAGDNQNHSHFIRVDAGTNGRTCTSQSFPVNLTGDKSYQLSFRYKNNSGSKLQFYYNLGTQNGDQQNYQYFVEDVVDSGGWHTYTHDFTIPESSVREFDLFLYADGEGSAANSNDFDDIKLTQAAPSNGQDYYLFQQTNKPERSPKPEIIARHNIFGRYNISIKNSPQYFILTTGTPFGYGAVIPKFPNNLAYLAAMPREMIEAYKKSPNHVELNGSENSFLIDASSICGTNNCKKNPDGTTNINLEIIDSHTPLALVAFVLLAVLSLAWVTWYATKIFREIQLW